MLPSWIPHKNNSNKPSAPVLPLQVSSSSESISLSTVTPSVKSQISSQASTLSNSSSVTVLTYDPSDSCYAHNWSTTKKLLIVLHSYIIIINSVLGSSLPSLALPSIAKAFNVPHSTSLLSVSLYLIAHIFAPCIWGPLSETYGRRPILLYSFLVFTLFTILCGASPNITALLTFRFFAGLGASAPISVAGGLYADLFDDAQKRGRVVGLMTGITTLGPVIGPVFVGRLSESQWRWTFWIAGIIAGFTALPFLFFPETYPPILLTHRARSLRISSSPNIFSPHERAAPPTLSSLLSQTLTRPLRMLITEPIILLSSLFLATCFGAYYLLFEAYSTIFHPSPTSPILPIYTLSPPLYSLSFLPIGIGALFSFPCLLAYDWILTLSIRRGHKWALHPASFRLPLAFLGGPMYAVSIFLLAWSARKSISWLIPASSGFWFGLGMELTYIALLNYVTDRYVRYAASAMAAANMVKSLFGAVMPLCWGPLVKEVGVKVATSLLGGLCAGLAVVPVVFFVWGGRIGGRGGFCEKEDGEGKAEVKKQGAESV